MSTEQKPIPDWKLERLLAEGQDTSSLDPASQRRLEELRSSNRDILERYPSRVVAAEVARRREEARPARRTPWVFGLATAATAAAALVFFLRAEGPNPSPMPGTDVEITRSKGVAPHLVVKRKKAQGAERLADGAEVTAGDVIQLEYVAGDALFGAILSIDGRGTVTQHMPADGPPNQALQGHKALSFAYELDDAPDFERFVFVTSRAALDGDAIMKSVRAVAADPGRRSNASLSLPAGVEQSWFLLRKSKQP